MDSEVVWLFEQRRYAFLVQRNAYHSIVCWTEDDGNTVEIEVMNDDYEFWNERAIDFGTD